MDEVQVTDQAENTPVAEDSIQDTSPVAEPTTSESNEADTSEPVESESDSKPTRAERRIRDLSQKVKQYEEQLNQPTPQLQQSPQTFEPGMEYDANELNQRVAQTADAIAELKVKDSLAQYEFKSNLDRDADVLPAKYPELDENSDQFIPDLVDAIEEEFSQRAFRSNKLDTSVRLADIAARQVKVARAAAQKSNAEMKNAVAKVADTSAIRPGAGVKQEKSIDSMSSAELEAHLKSQGKFIKA